MTARVFGERGAGQDYIVRPSAYALILNERDEFAVVMTPLGLLLPGGGIDGDETPAETIVREALEESGLELVPGPEIARVVQLVYSTVERKYFDKRTVFLWATVTGHDSGRGEADHELTWLPAETAAQRMHHESHAWVLREVRGNRKDA